MGSRGPLPKRRAASARTADGVRLRQLPDEADAIFKRLARDIAGLTPADGLWERYLAGPETGPDPAQWRTELNQPLRSV